MGPAGVALADLTFIDEGNPDMVDDRVNFSKRRLDYSVIQGMGLYQQTPYRFRELDTVRAHLLDFPEASDAADREAYERSLELEPRGAERSQIA
jgi:son of sevenless